MVQCTAKDSDNGVATLSSHTHTHTPFIPTRRYKLKYCAFDTTNPYRDVFTGGLPGDGVGSGCNMGDGVRPLSTGPLATLGRNCTAASPPAVCTSAADPTGCQTRLLVIDTAPSTGSLQWTVFPQDRPCVNTGGNGITCAQAQTPSLNNPERRSYPYLPGTYRLLFGTASDTCEWGAYDRGSPPDFVRNTSIPITTGPCVRTLNVTDNIPPNITLNGPSAMYLRGGIPFDDPGATGYDLADGAMR